MKLSNDVVFTGFNQLWKIISGPAILLFIPFFLTPETQGYWFTFISISALAIFADLGFTNIVLQFSAHEFAHLSFDEHFIAIGNELHLKRLSSFFKFSIKWALIMTIIAFPIILIAGFLIFSKKNEPALWIIPWILYVFGSGINFFNNTLLSFFEGCNQVAKVQRIRLETSIINTLIILIMLYLNYGLYALAISMTISSLIISLYLIKIFGKFIKQLITVSPDHFYSWKNEFLRLLWRYALSWASGYFIFQLYTPLAFLYHGAAEAGKIGITMALWSAAFSISNVWIYSITPKINMLIAKRNWLILDDIVKKNTILSLSTFLSGGGLFIFLYITMRGDYLILDKLFNRLMDTFPMLCLAIAWFSQLIINSIAVYLRAHKQEPFVLLSVISSIYIALTSYFFARFFSTNYIFLGFVSSFIFQIPWAVSILKTKRKKWQN